MVEPGRAADGAVVDRVGEIADVLDSGAVGPGVGYSSFFAPARGRSVSSWTGRWTTRSAGMGAIRFVAFACGTSRRADVDEPRTCRADEPSSRCRAGRRRRAERRGGAEAGPLGEEDGGDAGAPAAPGGEERTAAPDEPAAAPDELARPRPTTRRASGAPTLRGGQGRGRGRRTTRTGAVRKEPAASSSGGAGG